MFFLSFEHCLYIYKIKTTGEPEDFVTRVIGLLQDFKDMVISVFAHAFLLISLFYFKMNYNISLSFMSPVT